MEYGFHGRERTWWDEHYEHVAKRIEEKMTEQSESVSFHPYMNEMTVTKVRDIPPRSQNKDARVEVKDKKGRTAVVPVEWLKKEPKGSMEPPVGTTIGYETGPALWYHESLGVWRAVVGVQKGDTRTWEGLNGFPGADPQVVSLVPVRPKPFDPFYSS